MNSQAIYLLATGCDKYPTRIITAYLYYIVSLLILFANFFIASYVLKSDKKKKASSGKPKSS